VTHYEIRCDDCGGPVSLVDAPDLLGLGPGPMGDAKSAKRWICAACETSLGFFVDYGTLDLGIVRDSVLNDRNDWVYEVGSIDAVEEIVLGDMTCEVDGCDRRVEGVRTRCAKHLLGTSRSS
jgi:hypothetical protein